MGSSTDLSRQASALSLLSPGSESWRAFANANATSPLQSPGWLETLTGAYKLHARVAALTDSGGELVAALPMIRSKLPRRSRWTSLPFTDAFEPIALDRHRRSQLLTALASRADGGRILIHADADLPGWVARDVGTTQILDVSEGAEGVLRGVSAGTRREVTRALRDASELTSVRLTDRDEFLQAGVSLIARSRRRLGAPTQPARYWRRVWRLHELGEAVSVGVRQGPRLLAIGVFVVGAGSAVYKYSASDFATRHLRTNYLMLTAAYDELALLGVRTLDFGISDLRNTGLRKFKTRWGGEERVVRFSATDPGLLPETLEPGPLLARTIQRGPLFIGRIAGSIAYPFVA